MDEKAHVYYEVSVQIRTGAAVGLPQSVIIGAPTDQPRQGGGLLGGLFGRKKAESKEAQIIALQEAVPEAVPEAGAPPPVPKQASVDTYMMYTPSDAKPEFPPFQTIKKGPIYDLRFYELYPVVEMEYTRREEGYAALGGYIGLGFRLGFQLWCSPVDATFPKLYTWCHPHGGARLSTVVQGLGFRLGFQLWCSPV
eukprot:gene28734-31911_t